MPVPDITIHKDDDPVARQHNIRLASLLPPIFLVPDTPKPERQVQQPLRLRILCPDMTHILMPLLFRQRIHDVTSLTAIMYNFLSQLFHCQWPVKAALQHPSLCFCSRIPDILLLWRQITIQTIDQLKYKLTRPVFAMRFTQLEHI